MPFLTSALSYLCCISSFAKLTFYNHLFNAMVVACVKKKGMMSLKYDRVNTDHYNFKEWMSQLQEKKNIMSLHFSPVFWLLFSVKMRGNKRKMTANKQWKTSVLGSTKVRRKISASGRLLTGKYVNWQAQESSGIEREEHVSISEVEMKHKFIDAVHLKDGNGNEISLCLEEHGRFNIHVSRSSTGFSAR